MVRRSKLRWGRPVVWPRRFDRAQTVLAGGRWAYALDAVVRVGMKLLWNCARSKHLGHTRPLR